MNQTLLSDYGNPIERAERAIEAIRQGRGVMVLDDENRENEGDMVFAAETITVEQMALTIRHGSGIVCLCLTDERRQQLELPMMVENNSSQFKTGQMEIGDQRIHHLILISRINKDLRIVKEWRYQCILCRFRRTFQGAHGCCADRNHFITPRFTRQHGINHILRHFRIFGVHDVIFDVIHTHRADPASKVASNASAGNFFIIYLLYEEASLLHEHY